MTQIDEDAEAVELIDQLSAEIGEPAIITLVAAAADVPCSTPIRRTRSACCARAASGHATAPPSVAKNFRRSM
jgi:hypothetical protein